MEKDKELALSFFVPGIPIPKGSTRAYIPKGWTRSIVTADNKKTKPWQQAVAVAANAEMMRCGLETMRARVHVELTFVMPRPKRQAAEHPIHKPDLDKLVRAVLDALTLAHLYEDDSQVCQLVAMKAYPAKNIPAPQPGVFVAVYK